MRFIIQYKPARADLLETMTHEEEAVVGAHFDYLQMLLSVGKLVFAGRRTDAAFGIAVFDADSAAHANGILEGDPAVKSGVFTATCGEFQFALAADSQLLK